MIGVLSHNNNVSNALISMMSHFVKIVILIATTSPSKSAMSVITFSCCWMHSTYMTMNHIADISTKISPNLYDGLSVLTSWV
jgi:hypothetical protein